MVSIRRALLSVHDKAGLVPFAQALAQWDIALVSTGGTYTALTGAGLTVQSVADVTGFPEILSGRVKTLHPRIHGGILADRTRPEHLAELKGHGIEPIDLVVVNLYPFERVVQRPGVSRAEAIEEIDIGGVTLLRAAAKACPGVAAVSAPGQYTEVAEALRAGRGALPEALCWRLAAAAFARTAAYDRAIGAYVAGIAEEESVCTSS